MIIPRIPKCSQISSSTIKMLGIGQERLINQMTKYDGKLFHQSSNPLSCQFGRVVCRTRKKLSFLILPRELRMLRCCAAHVFVLVVAYLAMCSHKC